MLVRWREAGEILMRGWRGWRGLERYWRDERLEGGWRDIERLERLERSGEMLVEMRGWRDVGERSGEMLVRGWRDVGERLERYGEISVRGWRDICERLERC